MSNSSSEASSEALAKVIVARLRAAGHEAWLVGGCVRDVLLGRLPKDFDVATSARPERLIELFPGADLVGAHFGVVLVREGPDQVEVATFRSDAEYPDGRHPESVSFVSGPREDALRRDFTINALFLDPFTGDVLDFAGGLDDLDAKIIRAIGDPERRFREDRLRLLRAVRFAARFGFEIEANTFGAMCRLAPLIRSVSAERVRDELARILTENSTQNVIISGATNGVRRGFELLDSTGLLAEILPEVAAMKGVAQPPEFHPEGDVWTHTLMMLDGLRFPSLTLALGVLLHDAGKPPTFRVAERIRFDGHVEKGVEIADAILTRLHFPGDVIRDVEALVANHMKFMDVPRMRESTLKRFMRQPNFEEQMELHRLDCLASHGGLDSYEFILAKQRETPPKELKPAPLITGDDLIAAGYQPGPLFARILSEVEDAQLEGRIGTKEEALKLVESIVSSE